MAKTKVIGKRWIESELVGLKAQADECKTRLHMLEGAMQVLGQQLSHLEKSNGDSVDDSDGGDPAIIKLPGDEDGQEEEQPEDSV